MRHRGRLLDRLTLGGILLGAALGAATLPGLLSPQDPIRQDLTFALFSPGRFHPLGTDALGRDVLARVAHGARVSLTVGMLATLAAALLGSAVGLAAGALGGRADRILMGLVDLMLAFPTLVLLLVLASLYRTDNVAALVLLLGLTTWMPVARLVRAESLSLARRPFMEAAASIGSPPIRRAIRHLGPNLLPTVLVAATLQVGDMMLIESALSYLGLGVAPPTPSWGDMVRQGMPNLGDAWWVATFPGMALALTVIAFNLVGDALRDALDPRLTPPAWDPSLAAGRSATS